MEKSIISVWLALHLLNSEREFVSDILRFRSTCLLLRTQFIKYLHSKELYIQNLIAKKCKSGQK